MTMGIVLVAALAGSEFVVTSQNDQSTLSCTSSPQELGYGHITLSVAMLNQYIFLLNVTEISKPLPECLDAPPGSGKGATTHVAYPGLSRLLRRAK